MKTRGSRKVSAGSITDLATSLGGPSRVVVEMRVGLTG
jgi:hypothetical protein